MNRKTKKKESILRTCFKFKNSTKMDGAGRLEKGSACPPETLICTHGERNRSVNPAWLVNAQGNK